MNENFLLIRTQVDIARDCVQKETWPGVSGINNYDRAHYNNTLPIIFCYKETQLIFTLYIHDSM